MRESQRKFRKTFQKIHDQKADVVEEYKGWLGLYSDDGGRIVNVPSRPNYLYVRLRHDQNEAIEAYNDGVAPVWGSSVRVQKHKTKEGVLWVVVGNDRSETNLLIVGGTPAPNVGPHALTHEFGTITGSAMGTDVVWIYKQAFMPLSVRPTSPPSMGVVIVGDYYETGSVLQWLGTTGTSTNYFTPAIPSTGFKRFIEIAIDGTTNTLAFFTGATIARSLVFNNPTQYIPVLDITRYVPLGAVLLYDTQTTIPWNGIFDIRPFLAIPGSGGGGSAPVRDEYASVSGTSVFVLTYTATAIDWVARNGLIQPAVEYSLTGGGTQMTLTTPLTSSTSIIVAYRRT